MPKADDAIAKPTDFPIVGATIAASCLGVTTHRLRQLVREGAIKENGRNQYRLDRVVQGYVEFIRGENRKSTKVSGANSVSEARVRLIELQIEQKTSELCRDATERALTAVDLVIGPLKSDLYSIPARVTRDVAMRKEIEVEIERVLEAVTRNTELAVTGEAEGEEPVEAEAEEDA